MGKIIFLDVDGTLVDYENNLPASAVDAIRVARSKGHRVYLCTGRSKAEVYPPLWDIGLDGMIGGNGSYVEDNGQEIFHQCLTLDQCRHAVDWFHSRGLEFYLECNSGLYASEGFEAQAASAGQEYCRRKEVPNAEQVSIRDIFPTMVFGAPLYREDVNKISYVLGSYGDYLDAQLEFPDMKNSTWGGAGETALFGDVGVKDIDKGTAIDALLRHLGASRADTIAFGDAKVDIPMLEYCAVGVAMGNGGEEIRAMADLVTADVDKDGLALSFRQLGLLD